MRDGMNLVAMEYVAAQDPADPGVLVLSRFAGAAKHLRDALLVNPYDGEETAEAMHCAREMGREERRRRHEALMRRLRARDVVRWRRDFIAALQDAPAWRKGSRKARCVARALLVNEFRAIAEAIPHLPPETLRHCGGGQAIPGEPVAVLGPGTGLGTAIGARGPGGWHAIQGDGGHSDLAPVDDEELEVWLRLRRAHGRLSAEKVLSGPGLERLYVALSGRALRAPEIDAAAWGGEPEALRAHALFTRWLGRVAGNLALIAGARGGVYLAGGILPRWGARFDVAAFRRAFEDKPPYTDWLRAIPAFLVMHPQPGLLGLAVLADAAA
jgi:glucokinase